MKWWSDYTTDPNNKASELTRALANAYKRPIYFLNSYHCLINHYAFNSLLLSITKLLISIYCNHFHIAICDLFIYQF